MYNPSKSIATPLTVPEFRMQLSFAVTPSYKQTNRYAKRAFRKDAIRAAEYLQWIIDDFIDALFTSSDAIWYNTIYTHYLEIWNKTIQHLKNVKPKLDDVIIDAGFFSREYAPKI